MTKKTIDQVNDERAAARIAEVLAKAEERSMRQAVVHLAGAVGAAAVSVDVVGELGLFSSRPADMLSKMVELGLLGYDEELAYVLVPMG